VLREDAAEIVKSREGVAENGRERNEDKYKGVKKNKQIYKN
jgi:hypothetical protein